MRTRSRRIRARTLIGGLVVVAALAVGGVAWARTGASPGYRTAAVSRGSVTSTLTVAGTVRPLQSASVGFAQSGTVASVDVAAGQTVTAGQTLAQLDLTTLQAKLSAAQATEAAARQTLAEAEDGQLPSGGPGSGGPASGGSSTDRSGSSADTAAVTAAQNAVESAQQAADQAQGTAHSALAAADSACDATGSGGGAGTGTTDCLSAESAAMQAEDTLSTRQKALASAQSSLASQLTKATAPTTAGGTTTVTAVQLAQYQAALDADIAAVAVAQQNLDQGTAVSPLTGTVVSVGVTPGSSVSAGSSTQVIVISSPGGYEIDAAVPTADIASVAVGQHASVAPDGATGTLPASITAISPTATSSGFAVVLGLSGTDDALRQGASATVTLTTGSVSDGIVVPTSAVHSLGTRHVVEVLNGSSLQPAVVTTGVMGPLLTQVVSGLKVGQQVVLADLSSTVTSDSSTTTGTRTGLGGGRAILGGGGGLGARAGLVRQRGGG